MGLYQKLVRPALFRLDEERVHELGCSSLRLAMGTHIARESVKRRLGCTEFGGIERFGLRFENPVGVAAGFDKNAHIHRQLHALGFGFVEVGTVTFEAQPGNEKPRLFRIPEDKAVINRLGFNNNGASALVESLQSKPKEGILGINIGKNKSVPNAESVKNYLDVFGAVKEYADYVTINVSSPNTPGLRDLQRVEELDTLVAAVIEANAGHLPILLKIAPDLTGDEIDGIVGICIARGISGIIATNTTVSREGLSISAERIKNFGAGGLSGRPLKKRSTEVISRIFRKTNGDLPIIGVGGVFSAEDAFEKILSGACLVQVYTGFIYEGPGMARMLNTGLLRLLEKQGFSHLDEAVGAGV